MNITTDMSPEDLRALLERAANRIGQMVCGNDDATCPECASIRAESTALRALAAPSPPTWLNAPDGPGWWMEWRDHWDGERRAHAHCVTDVVGGKFRVSESHPIWQSSRRGSAWRRVPVEPAASETTD